MRSATGFCVARASSAALGAPAADDDDDDADDEASGSSPTAAGACAARARVGASDSAAQAVMTARRMVFASGPKRWPRRRGRGVSRCPNANPRADDRRRAAPASRDRRAHPMSDDQHDQMRGAEKQRLAEAARGDKRWRRWGMYLAERQWGTVREDYSASGDAWSAFPHEQAHSRAYRWGEDGLLGLCDDQGLMCFSLALWNGRDKLLKERPYGL